MFTLAEKCPLALANSRETERLGLAFCNGFYVKTTHPHERLGLEFDEVSRFVQEDAAEAGSFVQEEGANLSVVGHWVMLCEVIPPVV